MRTPGTDRRYLYTSLYKKSIARIPLIATLAVTLGISGLHTIIFVGSLATEPAISASAHVNILRAPLHLRSTAISIYTTLPMTLPSPSPTGSLPPLLSQVIATLQAQNRLLYSGNAHLPEVTLTFDDGPNPYYTPQILNILQKYNVKATFFCIGRLVATYPSLVKQEYNAGHIIGNHSWSHPNMVLLSPADIQFQLVHTSDVIQKAIGVRPTYFRPPYGIISVPVLAEAYHLGLTTVIWNDEARDWQRPGVSVIIQRILGLARNGAIILMHDGGGDRSQTVAALPYIIKGLRLSGFQLVTLSQMLLDLHQQTSAATTYRGSPIKA